MVLSLTLLFPVVLLALPLLMDRIERPLRSEAMIDSLPTVLSSARPDELERLVSEGYAPAVERYWRRRRRLRLLPLRSRG